MGREATRASPILATLLYSSRHSKQVGVWEVYSRDDRHEYGHKVRLSQAQCSDLGRSASGPNIPPTELRLERQVPFRMTISTEAAPCGRGPTKVKTDTTRFEDASSPHRLILRPDRLAREDFLVYRHNSGACAHSVHFALLHHAPHRSRCMTGSVAANEFPSSTKCLANLLSHRRDKGVLLECLAATTTARNPNLATKARYESPPRAASNRSLVLDAVALS